MQASLRIRHSVCQASAAWGSLPSVTLGKWVNWHGAMRGHVQSSGFSHRGVKVGHIVTGLLTYPSFMAQLPQRPVFRHDRCVRLRHAMSTMSGMVLPPQSHRLSRCTPPHPCSVTYIGPCKPPRTQMTIRLDRQGTSAAADVLEHNAAACSTSERPEVELQRVLQYTTHSEM